jgi:streptomycin 3"-adenylyltransferase
MADMDWSEDVCMYHVLNRCRTLALMKSGLVLSKKEGAQWALENTDCSCHSIIREALACYESDKTMTSVAEAEIFCQNTLDMIKSFLPKTEV